MVEDDGEAASGGTLDQPEIILVDYSKIKKEGIASPAELASPITRITNSTN